MAQYGMVIDLHKCVGCGACAIACKTENNTGDRANGQTFNWADFLITQEGTFPDVKYTTMPVLCNHCSRAACVEACPVTPKAMFKTPDGITMHNDERCIGCQSCQEACPYSALDVDDEGRQYSVISFNENGVAHALYSGKREVIPGGTSSGAEVAGLSRQTPPHRTLYRHPDYDNVRRADVVEKCILCAHRVELREAPRCVEACPAGARIFGDLDDPKAEVREAMKRQKAFRLREDAGTEPNVYYVGEFSGRKNA